jgi:hypothetical protein
LEIVKELLEGIGGELFRGDLERDLLITLGMLEVKLIAAGPGARPASSNLCCTVHKVEAEV